MNILLSGNESRNLDVVPDEVDDMNFCVLDFSAAQTNPDDVDFYFRPLRVVEEFSATAAVIRIGRHRMKAPLNWHILIACPDTFEIQLMELTELHAFSFSNDENFHMNAFVINPLSGQHPDNNAKIIIEEVYKDVRWRTPAMDPKCAMAVPLKDGKSPPCAFLSRKAVKLDDLDRTAIW